MKYTDNITKRINRLIEKDMMDSTSVSTIYRQKFFNKYTFRIDLTVDAHDFFKFSDMIEQIKPCLEHIAFLSERRETYELFVYGTDPKIFSIIASKCSKFWVNQIMLIDPAAWNKKFPKPKPKSPLYFGKYQYRISFRDPKWAADIERQNELNQLEIEYKLVTRIHSNSRTPTNTQGIIKDSYLYVNRLPEVLVVKLMYASDILEVSKR